MVNFLRKNNKITEVHELRNCFDRRDVCTFHLLFNPLTFDIRFLWDSSTPFGFPVVPENENDERRVEWSMKVEWGLMKWMKRKGDQVKEKMKWRRREKKSRGEDKAGKKKRIEEKMR